METYIDIVKQILLQALLSQHSSLSEEAFTATCGFIVSAEVPVMRLGLEQLLEPMLNVRTMTTLYIGRVELHVTVFKKFYCALKFLMASVKNFGPMV